MKVNPRVEQLERENKMLRAQIERMRADPGDVPFFGCGDNSCITVDGPGGMGTNGGCRCDETKLRRAMMWWRRVAQFRQATIQELKKDGIALSAADNLVQILRGMLATDEDSLADRCLECGSAARHYGWVSAALKEYELYRKEVT